MLRDYRTAPIAEKLRAALGLLEKLTLRPDTVGREDMDEVRRHSISDDAIEDAVFVCVLFNTYVRLADTFEFDIPPAAGFEFSAKMLLSRSGYSFPPPLVWLIPK